LTGVRLSEEQLDGVEVHLTVKLWKLECFVHEVNHSRSDGDETLIVDGCLHEKLRQELILIIFIYLFEFIRTFK
jgi:hypothetical protein